MARLISKVFIFISSEKLSDCGVMEGGRKGRERREGKGGGRERREGKEENEGGIGRAAEGRIGSYDVCRVLEYTCLDPVLRHDDFFSSIY